MPTSSTPQAAFVFRGTVVRTKAATMPVPDDSRTAVVRVEEILRGPDMLRGHEGKEITVQLAPKERLKKGQQAIFHTNGWLYGKSLAVQSVRHEAVSSARAASVAESATDPGVESKCQGIRQRASKADLVITGRVVAVGVPESQPPAIGATSAPGSALEAAARPRERISEHTPFWTDAVVDVERVHKGRKRLKRVVV